ncbi:MAG: hypothetical protein ACF8TS_12850 [Maioricimonas sp. JB049]
MRKLSDALLRAAFFVRFFVVGAFRNARDEGVLASRPLQWVVVLTLLWATPSWLRLVTVMMVFGFMLPRTLAPKGAAPTRDRESVLSGSDVERNSGATSSQTESSEPEQGMSDDSKRNVSPTKVVEYFDPETGQLRSRETIYC